VERDTQYVRQYVETDANDDVTSILDTSGNVQERYMYDPYGAVTVLTPTRTVRSGGSSYGWVYLFQGGRYDSPSMTFGFEHRVYSPRLGELVYKKDMINIIISLCLTVEKQHTRPYKS